MSKLKKCGFYWEGYCSEYKERCRNQCGLTDKELEFEEFDEDE